MTYMLAICLSVLTSRYIKHYLSYCICYYLEFEHSKLTFGPNLTKFHHRYCTPGRADGWEHKASGCRCHQMDEQQKRR